MTQPGYGRFDPYGRPLPPPYVPPPPKRNLLPWLIVGGAVLLSGLGILLVVLLRRRRPGATDAATDSTRAGVVRHPGRARAASPRGELPGGAQVADQDTGGGQARFAGSDRSRWRGCRRWPTGTSRPPTTSRAPTCSSRRPTPRPVRTRPGRSAAYFFERTLSGQGFTDGLLRQHHLQRGRRQRHRVVHAAAGQRRGVPAAGLRAVRRQRSATSSDPAAGRAAGGAGAEDLQRVADVGEAVVVGDRGRPTARRRGRPPRRSARRPGRPGGDGAAGCSGGRAPRRCRCGWSPARRRRPATAPPGRRSTGRPGRRPSRSRACTSCALWKPSRSWKTARTAAR